MEDTKLRRREFLKSALRSGAAFSGATLAAGGRPWVTGEALAEERRTKVPRKVLGHTGVAIPILQMGTAQSLDPIFDKRLHRAFREGVDCFDTALSYGWGRSHAAMATFMEQIGDRKKLWITSKSESRTAASFMADIAECLEELRTDYLDLYFMHNVSDLRQLDRPFLEAGEQLKKRGKIRFFGFSCHQSNVVDLLHKAARVGGIDAILFRYHFGRYGDRDLNRAIDDCKKAGIGLIVMKVQRSVSRHEENVVRFQSQDFTLAQAKLKAVWEDERIDSLVSEMTSVQEVRENVAAAKSTVPLSAHEWRQLDELAVRTASLYCEGCAHLCEPTLGGDLRVADALRFLMYHEAYGDSDRARRLYNALPPEARNWDGRDFRAAAAACPQGIDIAARLHRAKGELEDPAEAGTPAGGAEGSSSRVKLA